MNLYQKINAYLLRNHPNVWVTRLHLFAPIGLLIFIVLFTINSFVIGYNIKDTLPNSEWLVFLVVIPVLIYIVYWFVFQARYNVEKSGGRLTILQEYLNYFSYYIIFLIAFLIIVAIPMSNDYKISKSVGQEELVKDIEVLNLGHVVVKYDNSLTYNDGKYEYYQGDYIEDNYYYDDYYYSEPYNDNYTNEKIVVSQNDLYKIIDNYKLAYNKYSKYPIIKSAKRIVEDNFNGTLSQVDNYYWNYRDQVDTKIYRIKRLQEEGWTNGMFEKEALYIVGALIALLALFVWIFKQIHWRYFMFGTIALAVTPLIIGIFAITLFEILDINEWFAFLFVFIAYVCFGVIVGYGVQSNQKKPVAIVSAMYLQLFLPILPIFIFSLVFYNEMYYSYYPYYDYLFDFIYWSGWGVGLISIGLFKLMYKKMSLLPSRK